MHLGRGVRPSKLTSLIKTLSPKNIPKVYVNELPLQHYQLRCILSVCTNCTPHVGRFETRTHPRGILSARERRRFPPLLFENIPHNSTSDCADGVQVCRVTQHLDISESKSTYDVPLPSYHGGYTSQLPLKTSSPTRFIIRPTFPIAQNVRFDPAFPILMNILVVDTIIIR